MVEIRLKVDFGEEIQVQLELFPILKPKELFEAVVVEYINEKLL